VPVAPPRAPVEADELMPRGQEFLTVGHLYRGVAEGLRHLSARLGERALFVGVARAQATPELFRWPQVVAVTDLASGLAAVEEIIEQGEGARGDWRAAHYGRFLAMWEEFHELRRRDPGFDPARPVLPAYTRQPFDLADAVPLVTDPVARQVAELAGLAYEMVLQILLRFFTHTDESDEELGTLVDAAITLMAGVLRPLAVALTRLPVGPEHPGRTAGFAFQMHYLMGNLVPWREPAWALLHERMGIMAERCAVATDEPAVADAVAKAREAAAKVAKSLLLA